MHLIKRLLDASKHFDKSSNPTNQGFFSILDLNHQGKSSNPTNQGSF
jgi:hypothetical protein